MPPRNGNSATRSSNRNRSKKKDPQTADSHAQHNTPKSPMLSSPQHNKPLPSANQNKTSSSTVSTHSTSVTDKEMAGASNAPIPQSKTSVHCDSIENEQLGFSFSAPENETATDKVGDNRGSGATVTPSISTTHPNELIVPTTMQTLENTSLPPSGTLPLPFNQVQPEDPFKSSPTDPWHLTFNELRAMRQDFAQQMQTITNRIASTESSAHTNAGNIKGIEEKIQSVRETTESAISTNAENIKGMGDKIQNLRETTESGNTTNMAKFKEMSDEIKSLREMILNQQSTIQDLEKIKQDFTKTKDDFTKKSNRNISEMNTLLEQQRHQVEDIRTIRTDIKQESQQQKEQLQAFKTVQNDIQKEVQQQFKQASEDQAFKDLKKQAFENRHNIVITGLPEHETYSAYSVALHFFKTKLKLKKLDIDVAYRKGKPPLEGNDYIRPLVVKFARLADRNLVWRRRNSIPHQDADLQHIKIQADIPKQLREDVTTLYRVINAASSMQEFNTASVKDYMVDLHGKQYSPSQLENLPPPLRPSALATKTSDQVLAFFSKFCVLSNHAPSTFIYHDKVFYNMEQFLAFKRSELSEQAELIERSLQAKDPVEAKSILNSLRNDHKHEWQMMRENVTIEGLREKFKQNPPLAEYLKHTQGLQLGEASKNPIWGVGFTLDHEHILDTSTWNSSGNLLGKLLMQVRAELI